MNSPQLNKPSETKYLTLYVPRFSARTRRSFWVAVLAIGISQWITHSVFSTESLATESNQTDQNHANRLFLLDKAAMFLGDIQGFEKKVRQVAAQLQVPPEWLMTVMYAESRFDPAVFNRKGSGAVGLIQFMPVTAREMQVSAEGLSKMNALDQLNYVHRYFQTVRDRYGEYHSLTDLYLAVLYPKARGKDACFALYFRPSKAYKQNSGLDENGDGVVTVNDIDHRLYRLFPKAASIRKNREIEI